MINIVYVEVNNRPMNLYTVDGKHWFRVESLVVFNAQRCNQLNSQESESYNFALAILAKSVISAYLCGIVQSDKTLATRVALEWGFQNTLEFIRQEELAWDSKGTRERARELMRILSIDTKEWKEWLIYNS